MSPKERAIRLAWCGPPRLSVLEAHYLRLEARTWLNTRGEKSTGPLIFFLDGEPGRGYSRDMNTNKNMPAARPPLFMVIDAKTGAHIREAAPAEVARFRSEARASTYAVRLTPFESVIEWTGPGQWFGGAGF